MRFLATSAIRVVAPCCCAIGPAGWALDFAPGNREGPTLESFLDGRTRGLVLGVKKENAEW